MRTLLPRTAPKSEHDPDLEAAAANLSMHRVTGDFEDPVHEAAFAAQLFRQLVPAYEPTRGSDRQYDAQAAGAARGSPSHTSRVCRRRGVPSGSHAGGSARCEPDRRRHHQGAACRADPAGAAWDELRRSVRLDRCQQVQLYEVAEAGPARPTRSSSAQVEMIRSALYI